MHRKDRCIGHELNGISSPGILSVVIEKRGKGSSVRKIVDNCSLSEGSKKYFLSLIDFCEEGSYSSATVEVKKRIFKRKHFKELRALQKYLWII